MLRAVVLTQYHRDGVRQTDGKTDRQTDGIAVASTAMRALRRTVKMKMLALMFIAANQTALTSSRRDYELLKLSIVFE